MYVRDEYQSSEPLKRFSRSCYIFVAQEWQHIPRDTIKDQGFERQFREYCVRYLHGWSISQEREMTLGSGVSTSSGVLHEIDLVAQIDDFCAIAELKNRQGQHPHKNDVIVFFAKLLDYVVCNPDLLLKDICPVFMSSITFERSGLAACLGLGIHPVSPMLRPLPILIHNAKILERAIRDGLAIEHTYLERYYDFCAKINRLSFALRDTWFSSRYSRLSENKLFIQSVCELDTLALTEDFREINSEYAQLSVIFDRARK
jgi:hypothetical protein